MRTLSRKESLHNCYYLGKYFELATYRVILKHEYVAIQGHRAPRLPDHRGEVRVLELGSDAHAPLRQRDQRVAALPVEVSDVAALANVGGWNKDRASDYS